MADTVHYNYVKTGQPLNRKQAVNTAGSGGTYNGVKSEYENDLINFVNKLDELVAKYKFNADKILNDAKTWRNDTGNRLHTEGKDATTNATQDAINTVTPLYTQARDNLPYGKTNIPQEGAYGNYNGLSGKKTEALSRQANAIGQYTFVPGAQIKGTAGNAQDYNPAESMFKFSPIETEETKQREAGRQLWQQQNEYALGVQNEANTLNYNAYKQAAIKLYDVLAQAAHALGLGAFEAYKTAQYSYLTSSLTNAAQQQMEAYRQLLPRAVQMKLHSLCSQMVNLSARAEAGQVLGDDFVSELQKLTDAILANLVKQNPNITPADAYKLIMDYTIKLAADTSAATQNAVQNGYTGARHNEQYNLT
jgi:hypothetical protein